MRSFDQYSNVVLEDTYERAEFDSVLDKGTVDAIYLSAGDDFAKDIGDVAKSAAYVAAPKTGTFAVLSFTHPDYLWPLLVDPAPHQWDLATSEVRKLDFIYLYLLRRSHRGEASPKRRRR